MAKVDLSRESYNTISARQSKSENHKRLVGFIVLFFVFVSVLTGFALVKNQQDLRQRAVEGDIPVLDRVELAYNQGAGDGQGNGWGPHNTRIVRNTNGDIYTVATTADPTRPSNIYFKDWRIVKRDVSTNQWSAYLPQGAVGKEVFTAPNILRGPQDQTYVISTPNMLPKLWSSDTNIEVDIPGNWYVNPRLQTGTQEGTHAAAGITPGGDIYFTKYRAVGCAGAEIPGAYDLAYRQNGQWGFRLNFMFPEDQDNSSCTLPVPNWEHGRYEYQFIVPKNNTAMEMVGSLDLTSNAYGCPAANNNVNYYFNGIGIVNLSNPSSQPSAPYLLPIGGESSTIYHLDCTNDANIKFFASDVYVDNSGRTHILYTKNKQGTYGARHAVVENGNVVKDVQVDISYNDKAKIIQDTQGKFFLISAGPGANGDTCTLYVQKSKEGDTDGTQMDSVISMPLTTSSGSSFQCSTIQNHFIAAPRSGTPLAEYVDGMVAAKYGVDWVYYRLQLHGGIAQTPSATPPPDTARLKGQISITSQVEAVMPGDTFQAFVVVSAPENFKSAAATINVSSNLEILNVSSPPPYYGPCNFNNIETAPTVSNLSFSESYNSGGGANSCTVYQVNVKVLSEGSASLSVNGGSIKAFSDNAEIFGTGKSLAINIGENNLTGTIEVLPSSGNFTNGQTFQASFMVKSTSTPFNAAQADITHSSNLLIESINLSPANSCSFQYLSGHTPQNSNLSFVGSIINNSSTNCIAFTATFKVVGTGTGTISVSNGSIRSYNDSTEIFANAVNGNYQLSSAPTPTPTPTNIPLATATLIPIPTNTPIPIPTSTPAPTPIVCVAFLHSPGDANGSGLVDEVDLAILSSQWLFSNTNLTALSADFNCDGIVNLADFSIIAKNWSLRL